MDSRILDESIFSTLITSRMNWILLLISVAKLTIGSNEPGDRIETEDEDI